MNTPKKCQRMVIMFIIDISLDSDAEDDAPLLTLAAVLTIETMTAALFVTTKGDKLCNSDEAIVQACQSMDVAVEEKSKNQWIIEHLKLKPFSLLCHDHNNDIIEYNVLGHHEISDRSTALLLDKDWIHERHVKYSCAQILAGAVMMNLNNGESILLNTAEVYGRTKSVDIHREMTTSATSSILLWPCIQNMRDGYKLVMDTLSCNCLTTSIVCLDRNEEPKVGPLSFHFVASPQHTKFLLS